MNFLYPERIMITVSIPIAFMYWKSRSHSASPQFWWGMSWEISSRNAPVICNPLFRGTISVLFSDSFFRTESGKFVLAPCWLFPAQAAIVEVAAMEAPASAAFFIKSRRLFFSLFIVFNLLFLDDSHAIINNLLQTNVKWFQHTRC